MENINKEEFIKSLKFDEKGLIPARDLPYFSSSVRKMRNHPGRRAAGGGYLARMRERNAEIKRVY